MRVDVADDATAKTGGKEFMGAGRESRLADVARGMGD
jgi:hypothetical protein